MTENTQIKGFLLIVAAVMGITSLILSVLTWSRITESINEVEGSRDLRGKWGHVLSLLKDAETGQRGFIITGDEEYLGPFEAAVRDMPQAFEDLTLLHAGTGSMADEVVRIRALADERLALLHEVISLQRKAGLDPARDLIRTGRGKKLMDKLRTRIGIIETRLDGTVTKRTLRMRTDLKWGYLSAVAAGVVALGAGTVAWLLFLESLKQGRREERLTAGKLRAEQADREKSTFLATMSHEIRTPMNAILGFGELLEGEVQTEKGQRHVQSILAGGRALLQIINDILDLAKIEAGMLEVRPEPTDLREVATFIQQLFGQQAALKGVDLRIETAPDLPHALLVDGMRIRQVLLNLVGNALKFTDHGQIAVRLGGDRRPDEGSLWRLTIAVQDSGIGIPAVQLSEVFKPFVQAQATSESQHRGTGLGLSIVQRLTDLMGGSIAVSSEVGRGTTFTLEFPQAEIPAELPGSLSPDERRVDFNDLRPCFIIAADDNETNRTLMLGIFENTHHRLRLVSNGREAVEAILEARPDIVLMDVRMPVMDGREALEALRARSGVAVMPVIAVTASSLAAEEAGLRRTFDGYVRKPFSRAELFRELAQFIPRVTAVPEVPGPVALAPTDEEARRRWRVLATQLRLLEQTSWPGVRDSMSMSGIAHFAARLRTEAAAAACPPLLSYAAGLLADTESFAVGALESCLADFPRLVGEIETASSLSP